MNKDAQSTTQHRLSRAKTLYKYSIWDFKFLIGLTICFSYLHFQSEYRNIEFLWSTKLINNHHTDFQSVIMIFLWDWYIQLTNHEDSWPFTTDKTFSQNEEQSISFTWSQPPLASDGCSLSVKDSRKILICGTLRPQAFLPVPP